MPAQAPFYAGISFGSAGPQRVLDCMPCTPARAQARLASENLTELRSIPMNSPGLQTRQDFAGVRRRSGGVAVEPIPGSVRRDVGILYSGVCEDRPSEPKSLIKKVF